MKLDGTGKVVKQRELKKKPARKYWVTTLERVGDDVTRTTRMLTMKQIVALVNKRRRAEK